MRIAVVSDYCICKIGVLFLLMSLLLLSLTQVGQSVPETSEESDSSLLGSSPAPINKLLFSENFEGIFPSLGQTVTDYNSNNGLDYWDDSNYRSHSGKWSGWCAQGGDQGMIVYSQNFESTFPPTGWTVNDWNVTSGLDYWYKSSYRSHGGSASVWCAGSGIQHDTPKNNAAIHKYDIDMQAVFLKSPVDIGPGYFSAALSYYYWTDCGNFDYLAVMYRVFAGTWKYVDVHTGGSGGWKMSTVTVPTNAEFGFFFFSDASDHDHEGAYVDDVTLTYFAKNSLVHKYDDCMNTRMQIDVKGLSIYASINLTYWYWTDCELNHDYLKAGWYVASWNYVKSYTGNSSGWKFGSISIPITASRVCFVFQSDSANHTCEGAYIDDITCTGTYHTNLFEDGFELAYSAWTGTANTPGEIAGLAATVKHHGNYAAWLVTNGSGGTERIYCQKTVTPMSQLYARGYFRVATSGIAENDDRYYFLIFRAGTNAVAFAGWRKTGGIVKWTLLIRNGTSYTSVSSTASPSLNTWYSVELYWKNDPTGGMGILWVDNSVVCTIFNRNTTAYGNVTRIEFGLPEIVNCSKTSVYGDCAAISFFYINPEDEIFTDGFESNTFNSWSGTVKTLGENVGTGNTIVYRGSYSATFSSNGSSSTERAYCYKTIDSKNELFVRAYARPAVRGFVDSNDRAYVIIVKAGATPVAYVGWRVTSGVVRWNLLIRNGTAYYSVDASKVSSIVNRWYCVELHWKRDAINGLAELWIDNALVCQATNKDTAAFGGANRVETGLPEMINCAATTVYCDSVKIAKLRIGQEP